MFCTAYVFGAINKISVVWLLMNCTYLCVCRSIRRKVCPYSWRSMWCNQMTTITSRGLLVARTANVLVISKNRQRGGPEIQCSLINNSNYVVMEIILKKGKKKKNVYFCVAYSRYFSTPIHRMINRIKILLTSPGW